ncbi:IS3 family transposase [Pantoea allii]|uniref:IS3 family transposase n=1 Tax=Pantoea allii TaxID=574096 RepID=UPI0035316E24
MVCVSRSNLYERLRKKRYHRSARYGKDGDARVLPLIRQICSERATNGYRRVTAHLNRALKEQSWRVNPKRIYRIMRANNLLLAKSSHKKPERCHTGNVVTLKLDTRWCSDSFEIRCWNREVGRAVFSLDCCDRDAICCSATTDGSVSAPLKRSIIF